MQFCDFKSNSRCALVRFWSHAHDFRPNCTPLSSITIVTKVQENTRWLWWYIVVFLILFGLFILVIGVLKKWKSILIMPETRTPPTVTNTSLPFLDTEVLYWVDRPHAEQPDLIIGPETKDLQHLLLHSMPEELKSDALHQKVYQAIRSGAVSAVAAPLRDSAAGGPLKYYTSKRNLARWNAHLLIRAKNNCYNYANDKITNSFAQPGYASGTSLGKISPDNVLKLAKSDGLEKMDVKPTDPCPFTRVLNRIFPSAG